MEQVTDLQAVRPEASGLTLELGLIFTTFLALLVGIVLSQWALARYYDGGFFG